MQAHKKKYLTVVLVALLVVFLDQITKYMVCQLVPIHSSVQILTDFLSIIHVRNSGIAFGMMKSFGAEYRIFSLAAVVGVTVFLLIFIFSQVKKSSFLQVISLSMILGGAIGNLFDRFFIGAVIDFIDVQLYAGYHWPAFNVADSAITVGIVLVLICEFSLLRKPGSGE